MAKNRFILSMLLLCVSFYAANAQWDVPYTQFWTVKNIYNPSFAGENTEVSINTLYKQQLMQVDNAPQTILLTGSMPIELFGSHHGVGFMLSNMNVGKERNSFIAAQYNYKQKIGLGWINIGVQAGVHELNFDANSYQILIDSTQNSKKSVVANPIDKKRIDLNVGVSWTSSNVFAGVGIKHINEPKYYSMQSHIESSNINDSTLSKIPISYNLMLGCNIKLLDTLFEIEPMLLAQTVARQNSLSAALQIRWKKKFSAGAVWNSDVGYSFFAGTTISGLGIRYACDLNNIGQIRDVGLNHELVLQYSFALDKFKPKPQPHKSIRLL